MTDPHMKKVWYTVLYLYVVYYKYIQYYIHVYTLLLKAINVSFIHRDVDLRSIVINKKRSIVIK